MNKENFLIIVVGVSVLIIIILLAIFLPRNVESISIITDKINYSSGDSLKIKIENNSLKDICFSSCYPYYFEKKGDQWKDYKYQECSKQDIIETCINPGKVKAFEMEVPSLEEGSHRIVLPICTDCQTGRNFQENKRYYSNEIIIK